MLQISPLYISFIITSSLVNIFLLIILGLYLAYLFWMDWYAFEWGYARKIKKVGHGYDWKKEYNTQRFYLIPWTLNYWKKHSNRYRKKVFWILHIIPFILLILILL